MKNVEKEQYTDETISISREEFARYSAELLARITLDAAKSCDDTEELKILMATSKMLVCYTHDLMDKIFHEKTLQIEKEEK